MDQVVFLILGYNSQLLVSFSFFCYTFINMPYGGALIHYAHLAIGYEPKVETHDAGNHICTFGF